MDWVEKEYLDYAYMPDDFDVARYISGDYDHEKWHGPKDKWGWRWWPERNRGKYRHNQLKNDGLVARHPDLFTPEEVWYFAPWGGHRTMDMFTAAWLHAYRTRFNPFDWMLVMELRGGLEKVRPGISRVGRVSTRPHDIMPDGVNVERVRPMIDDEMRQMVYLLIDDLACHFPDPNKWVAETLYYHHQARFIQQYGTRYLHKVVK